MVLLPTGLAAAVPAAAAVIPQAGSGQSGSCTVYKIPKGGSVQSYVNAAEAAHKKGTSLCLSTGLSLSVSTSLTVAAPAVLDFKGATLTKAAAMNNWELVVTAPGVTIEDVTLDGNRSAGAQGGGLLCDAGGCVASDVHVTNMTTFGIQVRYAGSSLSLSGSSVSGTVGTSPTTGDGVLASNGGLLTVTSTTSSDNSGAGFRLVGASGKSSITSSSSSDNQAAGLSTLAMSGLTVGTFTSTADWHYGVAMWTTKAEVTSLTVVDTGAAEDGRPVNSQGSALALFDDDDCTFETVQLTGMPGFGLSMAGASHNLFTTLVVNRDGHGGNPGINMDHGSADNTFTSATVIDNPVGVDIGSTGVAGVATGRDGNVGNHFVTLTLSGQILSAINIGGGSDNLFSTVNATDIGSDYPAPAKADIRLCNTETSDNTISVYNDYVNSSYLKWDTPDYLVYADPNATDNTVHLGVVQGGYSVAKWEDANGSNHFS